MHKLIVVTFTLSLLWLFPELLRVIHVAVKILIAMSNGAGGL